MAKKIDGFIKLNIQAGAATLSPVGPALGQEGVNIMEFCKAFNAATDTQREKYANTCCYCTTVLLTNHFLLLQKTLPEHIFLKKAAGKEGIL